MTIGERGSEDTAGAILPQEVLVSVIPLIWGITTQLGTSNGIWPCDPDKNLVPKISPDPSHWSQSV